ncbi:MAG TPA: type 1 glutamine amidotransferase domain-containing protein [Euzebyales bacterium]|nr:type 1 glutamine amidotransferase domain-containing protein [Euzebyales bacterium]
MAYDLSGKTIAFLVANEGIEQVELTEPWKAVTDAGATAKLIAPELGKAQAFNHLDKADTFEVDVAVTDAKVDDYDGLVLPGGVANPDALRLVPDAVQLVRDFFAAAKPVGAICHAPWVLIEAGVVDGRTVSSWPSLKTDLRNAGATWVDEEVVVDQGLVTSRNPDDLPAFNDKILEEFEEGEHAEQARSA